MAAHCEHHAANHRSAIDRLGATGSMLCAIHCAALPAVLIAAPALGAVFANRTFEIGFVAFASALGLASLLSAYGVHRNRRALSLLGPGLALLWLGVALDGMPALALWHASLMALGGTLVAVAHVLNLRLARAHALACAD